MTSEYVPPSENAGLVVSTMPNCFAAVIEATTVPSASTMATLWPALPLAVANTKGCSPLVKFCAMPVEPTMSTVPPVTVAVRS